MSRQLTTSDAEKMSIQSHKIRASRASERERIAVNMWNAGTPVKEIAEIMKLELKTIYRYLGGDVVRKRNAKSAADGKGRA